MTKIRFIVCAVFLICTVALIPQPASAGVVYSTLGSNGEFDGGSGYAVGGSLLNNQVVANQFTLGAGTTVADAVLALGYFSGINNPVIVYIESDASSKPGSIIATLSQVGTIPPFGSGGGLVTFTCSDAACTLGAGSYWLVAWESEPNTEQVWDFAYQDALGDLAFNYAGSFTGPWDGPFPFNAVGFRIDSAASGVPEPTSVLLFATGVLGIGIARRRSIGRG